MTYRADGGRCIRALRRLNQITNAVAPIATAARAPITPPATAPALDFFDDTPCEAVPPPVGDPDADSAAEEEVDVADVAMGLELEEDGGAVISVLLVWLSS